MKFVSSASKIKAQVDNYINFISTAMTKSFETPRDGEDEVLFVETNFMLDELKQLSSALNVSDREMEKEISAITELMRSLNMRRPRLETFLNRLYMDNDSNTGCEASETSKSSDDEGNHNKVEETSKSDKSKALQAAGKNKGKENGKSKNGKKGKGW
ncbi:hypothetical protein U1Q18_007805 [Sarracenia purpurea var. burkii]